MQTIALRRRLLSLLAGLVWLLGFGPIAPAAAHATFDHSDPTPNAALPSAPAQVRMWFTEPLEHAGTTASLYDAAGKQIAGTRVVFPADDRMTMTLGLPSALPPGIYTVAWQTESAADGHILPGYFAFTIGPAAGSATAFTPVQNPGVPLWLQAVARWLALFGLALAVAIWPLWLLVLRAVMTEQTSQTALAWRARRFAVGAIGAAATGNLAALLV
ncbi:MAG TPA: copper resistance CopC family protein, partial [Thermomicrobiales bacterium]|nr:copper resistance CopC family protein [Thermomicrobiales bacterium]